VNATGWVRVDDAESHEAACYRANATGAIALAEACAARGIGCLGFSSDLVFDGETNRAYRESDVPKPLNAYGRSKVAMEEGCATLPSALVVRTAAFFSPWDQHNFATAVVRSLLSNEPFAAADDYVVTPSFVPHLVDAALDLLIDGTTGIWHLANNEAVSWADFARRIAVACGLDPKLVRPVPGSSLGWLATRPQFAGLSTERGASLKVSRNSWEPDRGGRVESPGNGGFEMAIKGAGGNPGAITTKGGDGAGGSTGTGRGGGNNARGSSSASNSKKKSPDETEGHGNAPDQG
jgi:dTDP-4-dehydrorhamnose reductase